MNAGHTAVSAVPEIVGFWFDESHRPLWFRASSEFDRMVRERFRATWEQARAGGLVAWEGSPEGALALVIVLDQFPLNMFRGQPDSFVTQAAAREVAERATARGFDRRLGPVGLPFLYLPFMHSESLLDQDRSVTLFEAAGLDSTWARHHREIVRRFGRFPHRNAILGRSSTPEEISWLASPEGFGGG